VIGQRLRDPLQAEEGAVDSHGALLKSARKRHRLQNEWLVLSSYLPLEQNPKRVFWQPACVTEPVVWVTRVFAVAYSSEPASAPASSSSYRLSEAITVGRAVRHRQVILQELEAVT
jgi:hypothetical protein